MIETFFYTRCELRYEQVCKLLMWFFHVYSLQNMDTLNSYLSIDILNASDECLVWRVPIQYKATVLPLKEFPLSSWGGRETVSSI